jgi:hypothetical protein
MHIAVLHIQHICNVWACFVKKVMFNRLLSHFKKFMILSLNQHAFQENLSIDNVVYNKSKAKGLFRDIEKAFDCVNHNILLHKLEVYGITGISKNLYSQYLTDIYQQVILKDNSTHCI